MFKGSKMINLIVDNLLMSDAVISTEPSTSSAIQETDGQTGGMTHRDASTQGKYTFMEDHINAVSDSFHCPLLHDQATQCPEQHLVHTEHLRNDRLCLLYTLSVDAFEALSDDLKEGCSISQLHPMDQLLMTLMELRLNLLQDDMAERFRVSQSVR